MKKLLCLLFLSGCASATSLERLVERTEPKVVKIGIVGKTGAGSCSGAFIDSKGTVLTCAHCFQHSDMTKIFIKTTEGSVYPGVIVKIDTDKDLALVYILEKKANQRFDYFKFGYEVVKGQQVVSFGSPLGIQKTVSVGWVANVIHETKYFVFHSAFISPGSSGGPLVDMKGRLVGVNEAMLRYGFFNIAHGLYMAIDLVTIREFLGGSNENAR